MTKTAHRLAIMIASAGAAVAVLAGCSASVSIGSVSVPKADLEQTTIDKLEDVTGQRADEVRCDGDLKAKVGATQTCVLRTGPDWLPVDVTATAVNGKNVDFDIEVGKQTVPAPNN